MIKKTLNTFFVVYSIFFIAIRTPQLYQIKCYSVKEFIFDIGCVLLMLLTSLLIVLMEKYEKS
jgi:hypothetical protein